MPRPSPPRRLPLFERISALCLAGALAGCAAPAVPPLPDNLPVAWHQPTTASPGALAPDLHSWWKALGDDRLNTLVDQALAQNLSLAQARSRLRQARALAGRDNMQYRPMVSAGARTVQDVSAVDTYFQASLDAVWELGLFGARESAQRAGQARLDAAVAGAEAARVSTVAEVVRSYADLRAAQYQEALVRRMEELDSRALALLDVRRQQRLGAPDESSLAVARLAQTRAQLAEPRLAAAHAAQSLAVLLGQTAPSDEWTAVPTWPAPIPPGLGSFTLSQVPTDLLRFRPEIRSAEAEVLKNAAELGSATAELYPRITLGASLLYAHNLTQNRRSNNDNLLGFGPLIDIPLFDWGRRRAAVDAQKEALDAALLAYRQAVLEAVGETESALSSLQQSRERDQQLRIAQDALQRRVRDQATLARLHLASTLDGMAAERSALQAAMELAAAQAAHTQAFVALYKSLGGAPLPAEDGSAPFVAVGAATTGNAARPAGAAP